MLICTCSCKMITRFHIIQFKFQTLLIFFILSSLLSFSMVLSSWPLPHLATVHHCLVAGSHTPIRKIDINPPARITRNIECKEWCETWAVKSFTLRSLGTIYQTNKEGCMLIKHFFTFLFPFNGSHQFVKNWLKINQWLLNWHQ